MTTATTTDSRFCSVCARQAGLDPIGYAGAAYETIIAAELPLPWPHTLFSDPKRMPPEVLALMEHIRDEYLQHQRLCIRPLGLAPDPDYSVEGMRRVLCWRRPEGPFAHFHRSEYLVPEPQLGPLIYALALQPERLDDFAAFRQDLGEVRDLLICTHGNVDAACSKFGYPTYAYLREIAAASDGRLRAWRTTHFGGHVFAPTLIDLPHGSYWAYIEREQADLLVDQRGDVARLRDHYRGWTGLPAPFLQVVERELFVRHGWDWLRYAKTGHIIVQDETATPDEHGQINPAWAEVCLDYTTPNGTTSAITARVEQIGQVETIGSTGADELYPYPQYAVAWLREKTREY